MRPEVKDFLIVCAILLVWSIAEKTLEYFERRATRNRRIQFRDRFRDTYITKATPEQKATRKDWK